MIKNIDHISIAVSSIDKSLLFWRDILGLEIVHSEEVESQQVNTIFFKVGDSRIELIEATDFDSSVAKFLRRGGSAIHHIALEVDDVNAMLLLLRLNNVKVINDSPVEGAGNKLAIFVHPESTSGVLLEFYQSTSI